MAKEWMAAIGQRGTAASADTPDQLLRAKLSEKQRKDIERNEELEEMSHEAKIAKLARDREEAVRALQPVQESPMQFRVQGGVNLGEINLQEEREHAREQADEARRQSESDRRAAQERADAAEQKLHAAQYEMLQRQFENTTRSLTDEIKKLAEGKENQVDKFFEQIEAMAPKLGFARREAGPAGTGTDPQLMLMMKKMDIDNARAEREFQWKMRQDERNYQREEQKDMAAAQLKKMELEDKRKTRDMLAGAPEILGRAIAAGMMSAKPETAVVAQQVTRQPQPPPRPQQAPPANMRPYVDAAPDESGEINCPDCQEPVAIGPTAAEAVCANCEARFPVRREGNRGAGPAR